MKDEIIAALEAAQDRDRILIDPAGGRMWLQKLQKSLGTHVADQSRYPGGRSYRFDCSISFSENEVWKSVLRVQISGLGPWVNYTFIRQHAQERWWAGPIRVSRKGFREEDVQALERLREWYGENGLLEVPAELQAELVPEGIKVPGIKPENITLYKALYGTAS